MLLLFAKEKKHDYIVFRKVGSTLVNSVYSGFNSIVLNYWRIFKQFIIFKKNPLEICKDTGNRIIFTGVDDPEKLKSIVNIKYAVLEEATEFTKDDFLEINRRLRGIDGIKIVLIL